MKEEKPAAMGAVAFAAGPNMVFFLKKRAAIIPVRYKCDGIFREDRCLVNTSMPPQQLQSLNQFAAEADIRGLYE